MTRARARSAPPRLAALLAAVFLAGCVGSGEDDLSVVIDGATATLDGVVDARSAGDARAALEAAPGVELLVFGDMPGSDDDEANLQLGRYIHERGLAARLTDQSEIASGAVDLFLAAHPRLGACDARIGVHAWEDDRGFTARDIAADHPEHTLYTTYFRDIGAHPGFYAFTLDAADNDDMHWMTREEAARFGLFTEPLNCADGFAARAAPAAHATPPEKG